MDAKIILFILQRDICNDNIMFPHFRIGHRAMANLVNLGNPFVVFCTIYVAAFVSGQSEQTCGVEISSFWCPPTVVFNSTPCCVEIEKEHITEFMVTNEEEGN